MLGRKMFLAARALAMCMVSTLVLTGTEMAEVSRERLIGKCRSLSIEHTFQKSNAYYRDCDYL